MNPAQQRALLVALGVIEEDNPEPEQTADGEAVSFDGGPMGETPPLEPDDPLAQHNATIIDYLQDHRGGGEL